MRRGRTRKRRRDKPKVIGLLALACIAVAYAVPGWQDEVRAAAYGDMINAQTNDSLREGEQELDELRRRLDSEGVVRPWGAFLTFDYEAISRRQTMRENGYDERIPGFTTGLDRLFTPQFLLGVQFSYEKRHRSYDDVPAGKDYNPQALGVQDALDISFTLYGNYALSGISLMRSLLQDRVEGPYVEGAYLLGSLGYALLEIDTKRTGDGLVAPATGETEGGRIQGFAGAGYDLYYLCWGFGLVGSVNYVDTWIDGYSEKGADDDADKLLIVPEQDASVVNFDIGAKVSYVVPFAWGAFIPQLRMDYVYRDVDRTNAAIAQYQDGSTMDFATDPPDRDVVNAGLTLQFLLPEYWQIWLDYQETFLDTYIKDHVVRLGVRRQF